MVCKEVQGIASSLVVPAGSTTYTNFAGNDWYGIAIVDCDMGGALEFMDDTNKNFEESSPVAGSDYDATYNWWGHFKGAKGQGKLLGRGVPVSL